MQPTLILSSAYDRSYAVAAFQYRIMLTSLHLLIAIILALGGVEAFATVGISAARLRVGLPTIRQRHEPPPSSGRCTCIIGGTAHRSSTCAKFHARPNTRTHLEMKRRRGEVRNEDKPAATASSSSRKVTQIDDGSPLGVAIVLLGGAWVVLGDGDGGSSTGDAQLSLPPFVASILSFGGDGGGTGSTDGRIWAVFITASVAAGISRLVRYYWNKK